MFLRADIVVAKLQHIPLVDVKLEIYQPGRHAWLNDGLLRHADIGCARPRRGTAPVVDEHVTHGRCADMELGQIDTAEQARTQLASCKRRLDLRLCHLFQLSPQIGQLPPHSRQRGCHGCELFVVLVEMPDVERQECAVRLAGVGQAIKLADRKGRGNRSMARRLK